MQLLWRANFLDSTGYSSAARGYLRGLYNLGVNVKIDNVYLNYPRVKLSDDDSKMIQNCINRKLEDRFILINHTTCDAYLKHPKALKNIGLTAWETDRIAQSWVNRANQMDAIWLPSQHNIKAFLDSGVNVPLEYTRHGINIEPSRIYSSFDNEDMPDFKFLSVFQWSYRKGYDILLKSFWQEFDDNDNVCLIIKTYGMNIKKGEFDAITNEISNLKRQMGFINKKTAPIYIYGEMLTTEEMNTLYHQCDCFVLPTRGEGVGLPYLESAIKGIPIIATGWGGQTDFLSHTNSTLIKYQLEPVKNMNNAPWYEPKQRWAEADNNHLSKLMREVLMNPKKIKEKAKIAKEYVKANFKWENSALDIYNAVYRLTGEKII